MNRRAFLGVVSAIALAPKAMRLMRRYKKPAPILFKPGVPEVYRWSLGDTMRVGEARGNLIVTAVDYARGHVTVSACS